MPVITAFIDTMLAKIGGIDWSGVWDKAISLGDKFVNILDRIAAWTPPAWMKTVLGIGGSSEETTTPWRRFAPTWMGGDAPNASPGPSAPSPNAGTATTGFGRKYLPQWLGGDAPAAAGEAAGAYKPVLDLIGRAEGTDKRRGYNETLGYGKFTGGDQNLTGMSLKEIDALQTKMLADPSNNFNSSAVGRYQITRTTLRDLMKQQGLTGDEKFDPAMQDRLAMMLIKQRVTGTVASMQRGFSGTWDSIPAGEGSDLSAAGHHTRIASAEVQVALRGLASNQAQRYAGTRSAMNTSHTETHINGPITVNTRATDATGVAKDMRRALASSFATQANTGLV